MFEHDHLFLECSFDSEHAMDLFVTVLGACLPARSGKEDRV